MRDEDGEVHRDYYYYGRKFYRSSNNKNLDAPSCEDIEYGTVFLINRKEYMNLMYICILRLGNAT